MNTEELTYSQKKYLFAIYKLGQHNKDVRSTDVAKLVGVSKASTAAMMTRLIDSGHIEKEYYGRITLTDDGINEANRIYSNCEAIRRFFEEKLMLPQDKANMDAVNVIAHISEETAEKFTDYILKLT